MSEQDVIVKREKVKNPSNMKVAFFIVLLLLMVYFIAVYFLEVNFRYAAYGYGISSAGLNLPNMFVRSLYGEKFEKSYPTTDKDSIFFNEKIGCINALEHFITWAQYKTKVKEADFLMVRDKKDPKPFRMFVVTMGLKYLKKKLHL